MFRSMLRNDQTPDTPNAVSQLQAGFVPKMVAGEGNDTSPRKSLIYIASIFPISSKRYQ